MSWRFLTRAAQLLLTVMRSKKVSLMAAISTTMPALRAALVTGCLLWLNSFTPTFAIGVREEAGMQEKTQLSLGQEEQRAAERALVARARAGAFSHSSDRSWWFICN